MDCTLARQILDRGLEPGTRHPIRVKLATHLAECAKCRRYQANLHESVLSDLLLPSNTARQPSLPAAARTRTRWPIKPIVQGVAACLIAVVLLIAARVATAALTIQQNVQSYIVPSAAPHMIPTLMAIAPPKEPPPTPAPAAITPTAILPAIAAATSSSTQPPTLIAIAPTALGATPLSIIPTLPALTATPNIPSAGTGAITVLLLGSDRRPGEGDSARSDSVIVARIDPGLRRVALLSLPRDLIVQIPGYGYGRINAALVYGDLYPELGGGLALARSTVSTLLNTPIDYAVMIDFNGFIGLIDAIGGIDIDVPTALYDGAYPTMDYGYMEVSFDTGPQHMDGERALQYARIRHMDSDFERARRQQSIILAAAQSLRGRNPLALLETISAVTTSLRGYITTDLPEDRMAGLAWALRDLPPASVERYVIDENLITFNGEGGGCSSSDDYWAECVNPAALAPLIQQWLGSIR